MATVLRLPRGGSAQIDAYSGSEGEVLLDLDRMVLALVDGSGDIHLTQHASQGLDAIAALTGIGVVERAGDGSFAVVAMTDAGRVLITSPTPETQRAALGAAAATPVIIQASGGDMGELGSSVVVRVNSAVVGVFPVTGMAVMHDGRAGDIIVQRSGDKIAKCDSFCVQGVARCGRGGIVVVQQHGDALAVCDMGQTIIGGVFVYAAGVGAL